MGTKPGDLVGTVIGGVYKLRRLIGGGVYEAEGKNGETVAIKVLHDQAARDPDLVARFQREACLVSRVKSPYVAQILSAGKDRDGLLWIAFGLLNGEGLDARLRRELSLSFADVGPIIDDALQGLEAAHNAGVIHRDIKPANLFVEKRELSAQEVAASESQERTRVLDFGISKMRARDGRESEPSLTAFDATLGSFAYMAPEQVRGAARVDERADIYAMGAVAFRALTGRLPFAAQNAITLIALKLDREPPSLAATTGHAWPASIEYCLERMMARDRDNRFANVAEARDAWSAACDKWHQRRRDSWN